RRAARPPGGVRRDPRSRSDRRCADRLVMPRRSTGLAVLLVGAISASLAPADAQQPGNPIPDAQMLLDLDLPQDADLPRDRSFLTRMRLIERLRMLETLPVLDSQTQNDEHPREVW